MIATNVQFCYHIKSEAHLNTAQTPPLNICCCLPELPNMKKMQRVQKMFGALYNLTADLSLVLLMSTE